MSSRLIDNHMSDAILIAVNGLFALARASPPNYSHLPTKLQNICGGAAVFSHPLNCDYIFCLWGCGCTKP